MRKLLAAPVVVVAFVAVAAACNGGRGGDDDDDGATTGPTPTPTATSASPQRLYVNRCLGTTGAIEILAVGSDGGLTLVGNASVSNPFFDYGGDGASLAAHPATQRLYAATYGTITAFEVNETTGAVTPLPQWVGGGENLSVMVPADGARVYAIAHYQTSSVIGFTSAGTALPGMPRKTAGKNGFFGALVRGDRYLFTTSYFGNDLYDGFAVQADGSLIPLAGSPFTFPVANVAINTLKADPSGEHLYFADYNNSTVIVIAVSSAGVPSNVAGSPFASIAFPNALAFNGDGSRLYATSFGHPNVGAWNVASTGALTPIAVASTSGVNGSFNAGSALAVTDDDRFLYLVTTSGQVFGFSIAANGAPERLGPVPTVNLGGTPNRVCSMVAYP